MNYSWLGGAHLHGGQGRGRESNPPLANQFQHLDYLSPICSNVLKEYIEQDGDTDDDDECSHDMKSGSLSTVKPHCITLARSLSHSGISWIWKDQNRKLSGLWPNCCTSDNIWVSSGVSAARDIVTSGWIELIYEGNPSVCLERSRRRESNTPIFKSHTVRNVVREHQTNVPMLVSRDVRYLSISVQLRSGNRSDT